MKSIHHALVITLLCLGATVLCTAAPAILTLEDLRGHPERWPRTLPLPKEVKLKPGVILAKGRSMIFVELRGDQIFLETQGETRLTLPAADSALVAEANRLWAGLTPAQREIDAAALAADPSLWPERVKVLEQLSVSNEWGRIEAGDEFPLISVEPDGVQLGRRDLPQHPVMVDARETDVFERARERVLLPPEQRPSRLAAALHGLLVDAHGKPVTPPGLAGTQLFALYYGAGWCAPCRQFSPQLVQALAPLLARNPGLTVIYLSNDKTDAAMRDYMQGGPMPWAGVPLAQWRQVPLLMSYARGTVPQLVVVDRHGRVLADSFQGDRYVGPRGVLQKLLRHLDGGTK